MNACDRYDSLFQYYGQLYEQDWQLLKAQVRAESTFKPDAVNPRSFAKGLAQFMDATWAEWRDAKPGIEPPNPGEYLEDPRDPEDAIRAQAAYMQWLQRRFDGNREQALAAYNWGYGKLKKLLAKHPDGWRSKLPKETRDYVKKILAFKREYSGYTEGDAAA